MSVVHISAPVKKSLLRLSIFIKSSWVLWIRGRSGKLASGRPFHFFQFHKGNAKKIFFGNGTPAYWELKAGGWVTSRVNINPVVSKHYLMQHLFFAVV
jgi:hypothetical protein